MFGKLLIFLFITAGVLSEHPKPKVPHINNQTHHGHGENRIIGGISSVAHLWPYMASLQYNDGYHFCGGVLVTDNWVLTAAHCVEHLRPGGFQIAMGEHSVFVTEGTEQFRNVTSIAIHPFYNLQLNGYTFYLPHDIALLKVDSPFVKNQFVKTVTLPNGCNNYVNQMCTILGWGKAYDHVETEYLHEARVVVMNTNDCRSIWGDFVYHGSVCTYNYETTACQGDSGGPLLCLGLHDYEVVGISSWGDQECGPYPSMYSKVSDHLGWIQDITGHYL